MSGTAGGHGDRSRGNKGEVQELRPEGKWGPDHGAVYGLWLQPGRDERHMAHTSGVLVCSFICFASAPLSLCPSPRGHRFVCAVYQGGS